MTTATEEKTLDKVRKLLAKAEAEGVTPEEAEALTAKAAELMARYGIEQARLTSRDQGAGFRPANRIIDIDNPWAQVRAQLLAGIAGAMRCQCVLLPTSKPGARIHVFGSEADLERADLLYTSLLLQMASALRHAHAPHGTRSVRAWNRSFLLGYVSAVAARVRAAEGNARGEARAQDAATGGPSTELVLASREVQVRAALRETYPHTRTSRATYSGRGYGDGYSKGQQANIGGTGLGQAGQHSLGR